MRALIAILCLTCGILAHGQVVKEDQPLAVNPASSGGPITAPASGLVSRTSGKDIVVRIYNSCFGTNLRGVGNPISPNAIINADVQLKIGDKSVPLKVAYPSDLVTKHGVTSPSAQPMDADRFSIPGGGRAAIYGNVVQMEVPATQIITVEKTGEIRGEIDADMTVKIEKASFSQDVLSCSSTPSYAAYGHPDHKPVVNCGTYLAKSGAVSATVSGLTVSKDKTAVDVKVAFPGQTGFCGGYYSPLMVFFDEKRPSFAHVSDFKLNPMGQTQWPVAGSAGYFLVLDLNGNGLIDDGGELFGDGGVEGHNGFKELAKFDSNKDKMISVKDKRFKDLRLWNDANADGISQPSELKTLKELNIVSLSLKYKPRVLRPLGEFAEERERSTFTYIKDGKRVEGALVDIWLSPVLRKMAAQ